VDENEIEAKNKNNKNNRIKTKQENEKYVHRLLVWIQPFIIYGEAMKWETRKRGAGQALRLSSMHRCSEIVKDATRILYTQTKLWRIRDVGASSHPLHCCPVLAIYIQQQCSTIPFFY
jgi:hypothetical protein